MIFSKGEFVFVVLVLAGVGFVSLANYQTSVSKARDTHRQEAVSRIADALEEYFYDNERYPLSEARIGELKACGNQNAEPCKWGEKFGDYMELPNDPVPTRRFFYEASADGMKYKIWTALELPDSTEVIRGINLPECGDTKCNFGQASAGVAMDRPL